MADHRLAQTWRSRIADCQKSGLSIQRWCEINGTTYRQYGYWRKRLSHLPVPDTPPQQWAAVTIAEPDPIFIPSLTVRIAGAEIELQHGFDPTLLRAVVSALGSEPC